MQDEFIVFNRLILNEEQNICLEKLVEQEVDLAKKLFKFEKTQIKLFFCYSINKHTCIETLSEFPEISYLVVDIHQMEIFYSMVLNYFLNGDIPIKAPIMEAFRNLSSSFFENKLDSLVLLLQAEKELLLGHVSQAKSILNHMSKVQVHFSKNSHVDLNHFLLKDNKTTLLMPHIYRICIFHEMAHAKFKECLNLRVAFIEDIKRIRNVIFLNQHEYIQKMSPFLDKLPYEDCACDVYAIKMILDYSKDKGDEINVENEIEAYIAFVINMEMMESIRLTLSDDELERFYIISWLRVMLVIYTLEWILSYQLALDIDHINTTMFTCEQIFASYRQKFNFAWQKMKREVGETEEEFEQFEEAWHDSLLKILNYIASLRG